MGEGEAGPPLNAGVAGEPADAGLLGRETKGEVVLVGRLRAALVKLNANRPGHDALPPEAIAGAIVCAGKYVQPQSGRMRPEGWTNLGTRCGRRCPLN